MQQDQGEMVALPTDFGKPEKKNPFEGRVKKQKERMGRVVSNAESDASEKSPDGWPTLKLYERVQLKGIWFIVTRMKIGSGRLGLVMMTTEQVRAEGLKEYDRSSSHEQT